MLSEAKTSRPRPKIIMKKYQINNIRFQIIAGKILTKFPNFTRFCLKNARLHNKTTRSRPGRGQSFDAETEAKILASRPHWPRGLNITATKQWENNFDVMFSCSVIPVRGKWTDWWTDERTGVTSPMSLSAGFVCGRATKINLHWFVKKYQLNMHKRWHRNVQIHIPINRDSGQGPYWGVER